MVDRRTDIFALGIVLYLLTVGKHPFKLDNDIATLKRICDKQPAPPPSSHDPRCIPPLERILMKALEKDPDNRYASMREMRQALDDAIAEIPGDNDIAAFVSKALSDRSKKRSQAIKKAIALADERAEGKAEAASSTATPLPNRPIFDRADDAGESADSGGAPAEAIDAKPPEPRIETDLTDYEVPVASSRSSWIAILVVLLLGVGIAVIAFTSSPEPRPVPVPTPAPSASAR